MKTIKPKRARQTLRKFIYSFLSVALTSLLLAPPVFAEGGNAITDSVIFKGAMKMLNDATLALCIITPILCGLLIALFSILHGTSSEQHDKEKWAKNRKTTIMTLIIVLCSSGIIALISGYFK